MGDPKAAIDAYEEAGQAAKTLFATDPVTQAASTPTTRTSAPSRSSSATRRAIAGAMDARRSC